MSESENTNYINDDRVFKNEMRSYHVYKSMRLYACSLNIIIFVSIVLKEHWNYV